MVSSAFEQVLMQQSTRSQMKIKKQPGVYVLILNLKRSKSIKVGSLGEVWFKVGWYAYVGSSCLSGGLRNRTDRHKRRDKSHHWHVDYFREHAELVEIWFSHLAAEFEHQWAKSLAGLGCTDVPVPKFGSSDCLAGCPAHFFEFERRPTASLFRSITSSHQGPPVFVQRLNPDSKVSSNSADWEPDYWLGATILEESRMQLYDSDQAIPDSQEIGKVGGNPALSKLLDDYSDRWSLSRKGVRELV